MSFALKSCVALSVVALLWTTSPVAEAGKKCAGRSVSSVSYKKKEKMDIVDTAVNAGSFKTLAAALQAAGLVDTLKGEGLLPFSLPPTKRSPSCRPALWKLC